MWVQRSPTRVGGHAFVRARRRRFRPASYEFPVHRVAGVGREVAEDHRDDFGVSGALEIGKNTIGERSAASRGRALGAYTSTV